MDEKDQDSLFRDWAETYTEALIAPSPWLMCRNVGTGTLDGMTFST